MWLAANYGRQGSCLLKFIDKEEKAIEPEDLALIKKSFLLSEQRITIIHNSI